jgi:MFS family permease
VSALSYVRGLNPQLPRSVLTLQAGGLLNAFGNGLVVPFLFIYLTDVRGVDRAVAGLVLATAALFALVAGPISGAVSEKLGAKLTLGVSLCIQAAGYAGFILVHHPWQAFAAAALTGIGGGAFWPSQAALIARLTPPERSHSAWGVQRVSMNVGIGLGGVVGGFLAHGDQAHGYQVIFLLDAATFLVYLCVVAFLPNPRRAIEDRGTSGTYAQVLRKRVLLWVLLLNTAFITAGISMFELVPAYVKHHAGMTTRQIGLVFLANTLFIGLAQLPITQLLEGRRRVPALAAMLVLSGVAWLAMPLAGLLDGTQATFAVAGLAVVFAVAECLHGGVQAPLVVDLAEPRLIERTMAMSSSSWQLGFIIGPAIGGLVLKQAPSALWIGAGAILLALSVVSLRLEAYLPANARRTPYAHRPEADELSAAEVPA